MKYIENFNIISSIERLVNFCLVKGVQPDELITAIFDKEYKEIETTKTKDKVFLVISYIEENNEETSLVKMKYTYDLNRRLNLIEQKINNGRYRVQWNREEKLLKLIADVHRVASAYGVSVDNVLDKIPLEVRGIICPKLKLIAA